MSFSIISLIGCLIGLTCKNKYVKCSLCIIIGMDIMFILIWNYIPSQKYFDRWEILKSREYQHK